MDASASARSDPTPDTGRVVANGIATFYVRDGTGPPIVFIHGAIMDHRMWHPQLERLRDEFTTIAYDLRGHGRTGGSSLAEYGLPLFVEDLDGLLAALDVERPILCGLSLGGCVAQAYAATYPDRVAGLILADTFTSGSEGLTGRLLFGTLRLFALLDRVVSYKDLNRLQLVLGNALRPGVAGDESSIQTLVDDGPTISHDEFAKIVEAIVAVPRSDLSLAHITVPTLVLYGEHEPGFLVSQARRIAEEIPGATLASIPDAGHASNLDAPEPFTAAVRAFARRIAEPSGAA